MQAKDDHPLGCDNHKEDPLNHCNVCEVISKDEQPEQPAESQDRGQNEDRPQCLPVVMGIQSIQQSNYRLHSISCRFCNAHCVGVSVKPDDSHCNIHFLVSLLLLLDHNSHSNQQNNTIDLKQETFTAIIRIYTCHCVHQS